MRGSVTRLAKHPVVEKLIILNDSCWGLQAERLPVQGLWVFLDVSGKPETGTRWPCKGRVREGKGIRRNSRKEEALITLATVVEHFLYACFVLWFFDFILSPPPSE